MKKVRITNIYKFVRSMSVVLGVFILLILLFSRTAPSNKNEEIQYKNSYVISGDTLWNIAAQEQSSNPYYKNKDIRYIIYDIQQVNCLENSNLQIGQELIIPTI